MAWDFAKIPVFPQDGQRNPGPVHPASRLLAQSKLQIGRADDPLEHEATSVALQVMRAPALNASEMAPLRTSGRPAIHSVQPSIQRASFAPRSASAEAPATVHQVLRSPGQPLDNETLAFMEPRFGFNFSQVRIHADTAAARSAKDIRARAYTVGHHVAFGDHRFSPLTGEGKELLAHELAHVVQQRDGALAIQRSPDGNGDDGNFYDTLGSVLFSVGPTQSIAIAKVAGLAQPGSSSEKGGGPKTIEGGFTKAAVDSAIGFVNLLGNLSGADNPDPFTEGLIVTGDPVEREKWVQAHTPEMLKPGFDFNQLNPVYQLLVNGYEGYKAYERGDYGAVGEYLFNFGAAALTIYDLAAAGPGVIKGGVGRGKQLLEKAPPRKPSVGMPAHPTAVVGEGTSGTGMGKATLEKGSAAHASVGKPVHPAGVVEHEPYAAPKHVSEQKSPSPSAAPNAPRRTSKATTPREIEEAITAQREVTANIKKRKRAKTARKQHEEAEAKAPQTISTKTKAPEGTAPAPAKRRIYVKPLSPGAEPGATVPAVPATPDRPPATAAAPARPAPAGPPMKSLPGGAHREGMHVGGKTPTPLKPSRAEVMHAKGPQPIAPEYSVDPNAPTQPVGSSVKRSYSASDLDKIARGTPDIKKIRDIAKNLVSGSKGSLFERWGNLHVFERKNKVRINKAQNAHLEGYGGGMLADSHVEIDNYDETGGEIWDTKIYSEEAQLDSQQLHDYRVMEQAGEVMDSKGRMIPVKGVNYLFSDLDSALAHATQVWVDGGGSVFYLDDAGNLVLLKPGSVK